VKVLWFGDLASTGFGTVTADTGREMVKLGIDVRFVSQNDFGTLPEPFASRTLDLTTFTFSDEGVTGVQGFIPSLLTGNAETMKMSDGSAWGKWKPDACFLLGDYYGMREMVGAAGLDAFRSLPSFHYVPIEGHDLPPLWNDLWSVVKPIAMTKFGREQIEKVTGERPPLVYHGVDSETFHPVSVSDPIVLTEIKDGKEEKITLSSKAACKYFLTGNPSVTLVLRTDRNMPRKGYPALIRAMAPVLRARPNVVLGLHCRQWDQGGYLPDTISKYPDIASRVFLPDLGPVPRDVLAVMYNAADVYASTSAEGFGLTIAEAVACGVPAVGIDYSAVPEVIGPAGTVVPVGRFLDNEYAHHWALPDEAEFGKAVAYLIDHPHRRIELGAQGPKHVRTNFRWDVAAERFVAIAQEALERPNTPVSVQKPANTTERVMVAA
jgi:glycosyltransferase involved in cell wall biosynthesis